MNLVWGFVLKHWTKLLPLLAVLGLALCVRHTIQANARASAYARVAEMTSHYAQAQEAKRMIERKQAEDSIITLLVQVASEQEASQQMARKSRLGSHELRKQLNAEQQVALDSITTNYEAALAHEAVAEARLRDVILLRTKERDAAEESVRNLQNANTQLKLQIAAIQPGSNTLWKIATAVAVVGGIVAYASHP